MLDEQDLVMLESAVSNWAELSRLYADPTTDARRLAEAFLDAHDDFNDIANAFDFTSTVKRLRRET